MFLGLSSRAKLLTLVPKPVKAVILLFPEQKEVLEKRNAEDIVISKEGQPKLDKTVFWIKQTVSKNALSTGLRLNTLGDLADW